MKTIIVRNLDRFSARERNATYLELMRRLCKSSRGSCSDSLQVPLSTGCLRQRVLRRSTPRYFHTSRAAWTLYALGVKEGGLRGEFLLLIHWPKAPVILVSSPL